jgi:hypothetical protein
MEDRLLNLMLEGPPRPFTRRELARSPDLFAERQALLLTPTELLPANLVGEGELRMTIPLPFPSIFEVIKRSPSVSPKLWLDHYQRSTRMIRWKPFRPARVVLTKVDSYDYGVVDRRGEKGLLDALKFQTLGRRDGQPLYYFGAIWDDNERDLVELDVKFRKVKHPRDACVEIAICGA